jgi:Co/Zn/Cd efflux system component
MPNDERSSIPALRRTVAIVAALNLGYFLIEFTVAQAIGSVSLFADSIDFLEDASVNSLVLVAIGMTASRRRIAGLGFAALLMVPSIAALSTAWDKIHNPVLADPSSLTITAIGALIVNGYCAYILAKVRDTGGSLSKAAFLSARNDIFANIAIIAAGAATAVTASIWPDVIVGLAIAALNANAAFEVYEAALGETDA